MDRWISRRWPDEPDSRNHPRRATLPKAEMAVTTRASDISHLYRDDALDPNDPDRHEDHRENDHHPSDGVGKQQRHINGIHDKQHEGECKRQDNQDGGGQPALCGKRLYLTPDAFSITQRVGENIEHLSKIAAHFPLNVDGHDCPAETL